MKTLSLALTLGVLATALPSHAQEYMLIGIDSKIDLAPEGVLKVEPGLDRVQIFDLSDPLKPNLKADLALRNSDLRTSDQPSHDPRRQTGSHRELGELGESRRRVDCGPRYQDSRHRIQARKSTRAVLGHRRPPALRHGHQPGRLHRGGRQPQGPVGLPSQARREGRGHAHRQDRRRGRSGGGQSRWHARPRYQVRRARRGRRRDRWQQPEVQSGPRHRGRPVALQRADHPEWNARPRGQQREQRIPRRPHRHRHGGRSRGRPPARDRPRHGRRRPGRPRHQPGRNARGRAPPAGQCPAVQGQVVLQRARSDRGPQDRREEGDQGR